MSSQIIFSACPNPDSPIVHEVKATSSDLGHQAVIVLQVSEQQEQLFYNTAFDGVKNLCQDTVYFNTTLNNGECFAPFVDSIPKSFKLKINTYVKLLEFFKLKWPAVYEEKKQFLKKMRNFKTPTAIDKNLMFYLHGVSIYSEFLDPSTQLIIRMYSDDYYNTIYVFLSSLAQKKKIRLSLAVMQILSESHNAITSLLALLNEIPAAPTSSLQVPRPPPPEEVPPPPPIKLRISNCPAPVSSSSGSGGRKRKQRQLSSSTEEDDERAESNESGNPQRQSSVLQWTSN